MYRGANRQILAKQVLLKNQVLVLAGLYCSIYSVVGRVSLGELTLGKGVRGELSHFQNDPVTNTEFCLRPSLWNQLFDSETQSQVQGHCLNLTITLSWVSFI